VERVYCRNPLEKDKVGASKLARIAVKDQFSFLPIPGTRLRRAVVAASVLISFIAVSALFLSGWNARCRRGFKTGLDPRAQAVASVGRKPSPTASSCSRRKTRFPAAADHFLFVWRPYLAFLRFLRGISRPAVRPGPCRLSDASLGLFHVGVLSSEVFGVILAGYASASKWSLLGGIREAAQVVSYEVPRAMCVLIPIILAGTARFDNNWPAATGILLELESLPRPLHVRAFWIFFICATASCKRAPFDLAEGGKRTRGRLSHRVQRSALVVLFHGRICEHVRCQRRGVNPIFWAVGTPACCLSS